MSKRPFDAAAVNWVTVEADSYQLEPDGTDFQCEDPGRLVVVCGENATRHRGVEVGAHADGVASVWIPTGARVFWLPDSRDDDDPGQPWESRLREIEQGTWVFLSP